MKISGFGPEEERVPGAPGEALAAEEDGESSEGSCADCSTFKATQNPQCSIWGVLLHS